MNTQSSSTKSLIGIAIVIVVVIAGYFMFKTPTKPDGALLQQGEASSPKADEASARILSLLNQIEDIDIDTAIFDSPAYRSLWDFSIQIPERSVGRANPFAPLPGSYTAPIATSTRSNR